MSIENNTKKSQIVLIAVLEIVIAVLINIGTSLLPPSWGPYTWVAWLLLIVPLVIKVKLDSRDVSKTRLTDKLLHRNRDNLILQVQQGWVQEHYEKTFSNEGIINIELKLRPEIIARPFDALFQRHHQNVGSAYSSSDIYDIFESSNGLLLILGSPGSGKTILLLDLTRTLIELAKQDVEHPIPIIDSVWVFL